MPNTPVDPELERQLSAAGEQEAVQATFSLRPPSTDALQIDQEEVRNTVNRIIKDAEDKSGQKVQDLNVMPRIQQFVLAAPPSVVRRVLESDEIASALANLQPESLSIEPVPNPPKKKRARRRSKPKKGDA